MIRRKHTATVCGHQTRRKGEVTAFGVTITTEMNMDPSEYCHSCLGEMAIQCAYCGRAIFIGDPVTLYTPPDSFEVPDHAVIWSSRDPLQVVGCPRASCADTGADYAGIWVPGDDGCGSVHRRPSLIERALGTGGAVMSGEVGRTEPTVIPHD